MTIEQAIYSKLSSISNFVEYRIYPLVLPQNAIYPNVVYQTISHTNTIFSVMGNITLNKRNIQFTIYSKTYSELVTLRETLKSELSNFSGTVSGIDIQGIFFINHMDYYDDELLDFYSIVEFEIFY